MQISETIQKELEKIPKWKLMLYLKEQGESSAYKIAKDLNWSTGKAHSIIKRLEKSKAVKTKTIVLNGRAVKLVKLAE